MQKIFDWLENSFTPTMNKFVKNDWISTIAGAYTQILPLILTGAFISFYNVFKQWVPALPDLSLISRYTFELMGLWLAGSIPYLLLEKKGFNQYRLVSVFVGIGATIAFLNPDFTDGMLVDSSYIGPTGSMFGMVVGLFVALVFRIWLGFGILRDSDSVPDFVVRWINTIVPSFLIILIASTVGTTLNFNLAVAIDNLFVPLMSFGQSYFGFLMVCFIPVLLYAMGISTWALWGVIAPLLYAGSAINMDQGELGQAGTAILCYEIVYSAALISLGGTGGTLPLNFLMLFSKSKKLKSLSKIFIGPSVFNINEPIVYGVVAWNPIMMLPMIIIGLVGPTIIYIACSTGLLSIPNVAIPIGTIPAPFSTVLIHGQLINGLIWYVIMFAVYAAIWFPFFKIYDKQCLKEEAEENE